MLDKTRPVERSLKPSVDPAVGNAVGRARRAAEAASAIVGRLWPWRYWASAVVAGFLVAWYAIVPAMLGPILAFEPVVRADFVQSVVASGHVEAPFRVNIGSQITGVVASVPVSEGQTVKAGDTLLTLDNREAQAAVVQAEGVVAQAEARMRQLRELTLPSAEEALNQSKASLKNAELAYDRALKLNKHGYGTTVTLDEATKALDIARAMVRNSELQVFSTRPGGSDYVMADTLLNQARAGLMTAQAKLSYTTISAPRDGVLISRSVERGNVVQPSNVLMTLSPVGDTQLVVQIDEKNLGLIALGLKAIASADAFPKDRFAAEVVYINPGVDLQRASVEVKLRVLNPPSYLRQDMTVSVDIEVATRAGALIAPAACLRDPASSAPWVMKFSDGRAVRQPVTVGLVSGGKAEVLSGLVEGDLLLPATSPTKEGTKVRAAPLPASRAP